jgi:hypothetical protein
MTHALIARFDENLAGRRSDAEWISDVALSRRFLRELNEVASRRDRASALVADAEAALARPQQRVAALEQKLQELTSELEEEKIRARDETRVLEPALRQAISEAADLLEFRRLENEIFDAVIADAVKRKAAKAAAQEVHGA